MVIEYIKVFENPSARVKGLAFHSTRTWILASLHTGIIQLWDYRLGYLVATFHEHEGPVRTVAFHPSQCIFASGGDDAKVRVWNPQSSITSTASKELALHTRSLFTLNGHLDYVRSVEFHSELPWILSASDDQTIRIWNWQSRASIAVLTGHNHYVMCATFSTVEKDLIASGSLDQSIRIWDMSGLVKKHSAASGPQVSGGTAAGRSGSMGGSNPDLFAPNDVMVKHILEGHERGVNWVSFHPNGSYLLSGSDDRSVRLWQIDGFRAWEVESYSGHFNNVSCVLFAYGGDVLLSDSEDKTIRVWDTHRKTCLHIIRREAERFWNLASLPGGREMIFGAAHDAGFVVFKLERERPAFVIVTSALTNTGAVSLPIPHLLHIKERSILVSELRELSESPQSNIYSKLPSSTIGVVSRTGGNHSPIGESPREIHYNPADGSVLLLYASGAESTFEFFPNTWLPSTNVTTTTGHKKSSTAPTYANMGNLTPSFKGNGSSVFFLGRNRFAALDTEGKNLLIYTAIQKELVKSVTLPFACSKASPIAMNTVLLISITGNVVVIFDFQLMKTVYSATMPSQVQIKRVDWSPDHALVALSSQNQVFIYDRKLERHVCSFQSNEPIKSCLWWNDTAGSQALLYSTHRHVRYCLPNASSVDEQGLLCQTERVTYLTGLIGQTLFGLDKRGDVVLQSIEPGELLFKLALQRGDFSTVARLVASGVLVGQAMISYLRRAGYPQLALQYVQDPRTRFDLALEMGDVDVAFEMTKTLDDEDCWQRLSEVALQLGRGSIVETAYQRMRRWDRLLLLYIVTGQMEKLKKLRKTLAALDVDGEHARLQCALALGEASDVVQLLKESRQDMLACLVAHTHGLEVPPTWTEKMAEMEIPTPSTLPPLQVRSLWEDCSNVATTTGIEDWPMVSSVAALTRTVTRTEPCLVPTAVTTDFEEKKASTTVSPIANLNSPRQEADLNAWEIEDEHQLLINENVDMSPPGTKTPHHLPRKGRDSLETSCNHSTRPFDHVVLGAFERAMQLLHAQYGVVNFKPLKDLFMSIYMMSKSWHPLSGLDPLLPPTCELFLDSQTKRPLLVPELRDINPRLEACMALTTQGKFSDALAAFKSLLQTLTLSPSNEKETRDLCRNYITAFSMEMQRKSLTLPAPSTGYTPSDLATLRAALLLVTLFATRTLRPDHQLLASRVAMNLCFKYHHWKLALFFGRRLLELRPENDQNLLQQTNKLVAACETHLANAQPGEPAIGHEDDLLLLLQAPSPVDVCHATWKPITHHKRKLTESVAFKCSYCEATYAKESLNEAHICVVCELTLIGQ